MQDLKCTMENKMKKYAKPEINVVDMDGSDVITTSLGIGTETPRYDEEDAIW